MWQEEVLGGEGGGHALRGGSGKGVLHRKEGIRISLRSLWWMNLQACLKNQIRIRALGGRKGVTQGVTLWGHQCPPQHDTSIEESMKDEFAVF